MSYIILAEELYKTYLEQEVKFAYRLPLLAMKTFRFTHVTEIIFVKKTYN